MSRMVSNPTDLVQITYLHWIIYSEYGRVRVWRRSEHLWIFRRPLTKLTMTSYYSSFLTNRLARRFIVLSKPFIAHPSSCVLINDRLTDWFKVNSGVRQGAPSPPSCLQSLSMVLPRRLRILDWDQRLEKTGQHYSYMLMIQSSLVSQQKICNLCLISLVSGVSMGHEGQHKKLQAVHDQNHQQPQCKKKTCTTWQEISGVSCPARHSSPR